MRSALASPSDWRAPLLIAVVSAAAIAIALASQIWGGLQPCVLCIWQRWAHGAVIALALLAVAAALLAGRRWAGRLTALAGLAAFAGAGIALYHVGVEQQWWPGTSGCGAGALTGSSVPPATIATAGAAAAAPAPAPAATSGPVETRKEIAAAEPGTTPATVEAPGEPTVATGKAEPSTTATAEQAPAEQETEETEATTEAETQAATTAPASSKQATIAPEAQQALEAPTILSAPDDPTDSSRAAFRFKAAGAASYRCSLDGGAFAACSGSQRLRVSCPSSCAQRS